MDDKSKKIRVDLELGVDKFNKQINKAIDDLGKLAESQPGGYTNAQAKNVAYLANTYHRLNKHLEETANNMNKIGRASSKAHKKMNALQYLWSKFKSIAVYRAIRATLMALVNGLKEGFQNLAKYDKLMGNTLGYNSAMSELISKWAQLKNTVGVFAGNIVQLLTPALVKVMNVVIAVFNRINALIAVLKGSSTFVKAKELQLDYADSLDKTNKSAKALKNTLFGFDELNVLQSPSGSSSDTDVGSMFEVASTGMYPGIEKLGELLKKFNIPDNIGKIAAAIAGAGLAAKILEIVAAMKNKNAALKDQTSYTGKEITAVKLLASALGAAGLLGALHKLKEWLKENDLKLPSLNPSPVTVPAGQVATALSKLTTSYGKMIQALSTPIPAVNFSDLLQSLATMAAAVETHYNTVTQSTERAHVAMQSGEMEAWRQINSTASSGASKVYSNVSAQYGATVSSVQSSHGAMESGEMEHWRQVNSTASAGASEVETTVRSKYGSIYSMVSRTHMLMAGGTYRIWASINENTISGGTAFAENVGNAAMAAAENWADGLDSMSQSMSLWEKIESGLEKAGTKIANVFSSIRAPRYTSPQLLPFSMGVSLLTGVPAFAKGGTVDSGQLFIANEAGPELVGNVGGKTTVTNQAQFTQGLRDANEDVIRTLAVVGAAVVEAINNKDTSIELDGTIVARKLLPELNREKARRGTSLLQRA